MEIAILTYKQKELFETLRTFFIAHQFEITKSMNCIYYVKITSSPDNVIMISAQKIMDLSAELLKRGVIYDYTCIHFVELID